MSSELERIRSPTSSLSGDEVRTQPIVRLSLVWHTSTPSTLSLPIHIIKSDVYEMAVLSQDSDQLCAKESSIIRLLDKFLIVQHG